MPFLMNKDVPVTMFCHVNFAELSEGQSSGHWSHLEEGNMVLATATRCGGSPVELSLPLELGIMCTYDLSPRSMARKT